jgi:hypothetical protein
MKGRPQTWTRKTFSDAKRFIELATEIVSLPDATTNKGPSLKQCSKTNKLKKKEVCLLIGTKRCKTENSYCKYQQVWDRCIF